MYQILRIIGVLVLLSPVVACGDEYTPTEPDEGEPQTMTLDSMVVVTDSLSQIAN